MTGFSGSSHDDDEGDDMNDRSRQNWLAISALAESIRAMGTDEETEKKLESIKAVADAALRTGQHKRSDQGGQ